jgi:cob(I)alamin adenosyltransferase
MTKYYSNTGDKGSTSLLGETRVPKSHPRIRAVGAIDEASANLGFSRSTLNDEDLNQTIQTIQLDLYRIMSQIVLEKPDPDKFPDLPIERVSWLEEMIEKYQTDLQDPKGFILPGDNPGSASLSITRTVVRRAEREVVDLEQSGLFFSKTALPYLNRLSSLCFVLELYTSNQITPVSSKRT